MRRAKDGSSESIRRTQSATRDASGSEPTPPRRASRSPEPKPRPPADPPARRYTRRRSGRTRTSGSPRARQYSRNPGVCCIAAYSTPTARSSSPARAPRDSNSRLKSTPARVLADDDVSASALRLVACPPRRSSLLSVWDASTHARIARRKTSRPSPRWYASARHSAAASSASGDCVGPADDPPPSPERPNADAANAATLDATVPEVPEVPETVRGATVRGATARREEEPPSATQRRSDATSEGAADASVASEHVSTRAWRSGWWVRRWFSVSRGVGGRRARVETHARRLRAHATRIAYSFSRFWRWRASGRARRVSTTAARNARAGETEVGVPSGDRGRWHERWSAACSDGRSARCLRITETSVTALTASTDASGRARGDARSASAARSRRAPTCAVSRS